MLASWVHHLVKNVSESFFPIREDDPQKVAVGKMEHRFAYKINRNVNRIQSNYAGITPNDAKNVGILSTFFRAYMTVFKGMITIPLDEAYVYLGNDERIEINKAINHLTVLSEK